MGQKVGVVFPSSWGAQFHAGMAVDCNVGGPSPALSILIVCNFVIEVCQFQETQIGKTSL